VSAESAGNDDAQPTRSRPICRSDRTIADLLFYLLRPERDVNELFAELERVAATTPESVFALAQQALVVDRRVEVRQGPRG
jgi:hypothetical protein